MTSLCVIQSVLPFLSLWMCICTCRICFRKYLCHLPMLFHYNLSLYYTNESNECTRWSLKRSAQLTIVTFLKDHNSYLIVYQFIHNTMLDNTVIFRCKWTSVCLYKSLWCNSDRCSYLQIFILYALSTIYWTRAKKRMCRSAT